MAQVLTSGSSVSCSDGGAVGVSSAAAKLTVAGSPVLLESNVGPSVSRCPIPDDPNTSTLQCRLVAKVTGGHAVKLAVGGKPVMLATLTGLTNGTPPPTGKPLGTVTANQTKLLAT